MLKKLIFPVLLTTAIISVANPASARAIYTIDVKVNNVSIEMGSGNIDARPYIEQETNTAYVPIRFVSENLGGKVTWDKTTKQVTIESDDGKVTKLQVGSKIAYVNNEKKLLPNSPVIPNYPNRVMVPLRFVSEVLGANVTAIKTDEVLNVNIITSK